MRGLHLPRPDSTAGIIQPEDHAAQRQPKSSAKQCPTIPGKAANQARKTCAGKHHCRRKQVTHHGDAPQNRRVDAQREAIARGSGPLENKIPRSTRHTANLASAGYAARGATGRLFNTQFDYLVTTGVYQKGLRYKGNGHVTMPQILQKPEVRCSSAIATQNTWY